MVRFVRTLQRRVTAQGRDFYALSIPPQVAHALGLKDGGHVAIEVRPIKKGKSEIVLKKLSQDDAPNHLCIVPTPDGYIDLVERPMPIGARLL
jgi:bifunctional DNA-binding transcriptional regulator/antitoxin component of YhaV-PrlF toxin-antitoxin module